MPAAMSGVGPLVATTSLRGVLVWHWGRRGGGVRCSSATSETVRICAFADVSATSLDVAVLDSAESRGNTVFLLTSSRTRRV